MLRSRCLYVLLLCFHLSCHHHSGKPSLFELLDDTGLSFSNDIQNTKDFNIFTYRNFYNGGGVAIGDLDKDGLADVFFTANMGNNRLYRNKGDFKFEDVTSRSGFLQKGKWGTGVVMADINGDGWLDVYVCYAGFQQGIGQENELYINNRNGTFTESARKYGLADAGYTTHAAFFDYDLDGDLDCYILNNSFIPVNTLNYANKRNLRAEDWPVADFLKGGGDRLLRNDSGYFRDVSREANIYGSLIGFGLGVTVGDVNGDHYPDLYISNDFFERDYLYINRKDGTFSEELEQWMQHTSLASMGADMGDINNDGHTDIFTTDMLPDDDYRLKTTSLFDNIDVYRIKENLGFYHQFMQNTLQLNNGNGKFMDIAFYGGVAASDWSWGGLLFDADNDGFSDIFVCNGIYQDVTNQDFIDFFANDVIQKMALSGKKEEVREIIEKMPSHPIPNKAFRNGGRLRFSDAGAAWGLDQPSFSNGAAYGDLDNDGDLDLVVSNLNQKAFVYRNRSREQTGHHYIGFQLQGKGANPWAVGSSIRVYQGNQVFTREVMPARGFQSSVDYKVIVGLGTGAVDSVLVTWPDRTQTKMVQPLPDFVYALRQKDAATPAGAAPPAVQPALLEPAALAPFERHQEDDHIDFYHERGLLSLLSREGPRGATADVNGDGRTDLYISGTAGTGGQLYLQTAAGFTKKMQGAFSGTGFEETAVLFFDADSDGDPDLFTGTGGNNRPANSFGLQNRLYRNDGRGNFTPDGQPLPGGMNTAVAAACDFDADGDQDLFIGSRSIPQQYGPSPPSFLLVNDGHGRFSPLDKTRMGGMDTAGLVTGAAWVNITGDARRELVLAGEWMAPRAYAFEGGRFTEVATGLGQLAGCWQSMASADLDGDGDEDLVLGNLGENFYLQPAAGRPVKLWMADFDNNGTVEKIITRSVGGKDVPVFLKRDVTDQIASLRKLNLKYEDFARKSIQDLFPAGILNQSTVKTFSYASSCLAFNEGGGRFSIRALPPAVQFSSVGALLCTDITGDGRPDIIAGGNNFGFQPQFSRLDASYGHVLVNEGKGVFRCLAPALSGIEVRGQTRGLAAIGGREHNYLLFLRNNEYPALYRVAKQPETKLNTRP